IAPRATTQMVSGVMVKSAPSAAPPAAQISARRRVMARAYQIRCGAPESAAHGSPVEFPSFLSELSRMPPRGWRSHVMLLVALAMATSMCWLLVVPPFEGPDELFFYNRARTFAERPERGEGLFYRFAAPIIRVMSPGTGAAAAEYNPAFQFISNRRGEVNRFAHDRRVAPREHVRTLLAMRFLVVLLSGATVVAIYATARLSIGDAHLALLVAAICLWIPQFSFVSVIVHPEAVTRFLAAITTLAVVAHATGVLGRTLAWIVLPLCVTIVPFADRQAFFLVPFAGLALVATERRWIGRAAAAVAIVVPAAIAVWIVTRYTEFDTNFGPWIALVRHPLWPFTSNPAYAAAPGAPYYAYEFLPKLFEGFWGW